MMFRTHLVPEYGGNSKHVPNFFALREYTAASVGRSMLLLLVLLLVLVRLLLLLLFRQYLIMITLALFRHAYLGQLCQL